MIQSKQAHIIILVLLLVLIGLLLWNHSIQEEQYEFTVSKLATGTAKTLTDVKDYAKEKWYQLRAYLRKHYREAAMRKIYKFLNNSNLQFLGKNQDIKENPTLKRRKTITGYGKPTLLNQFCAVSKQGKQAARKWLTTIMKDNFEDYLYEQWKLKHTLYRAILSLGENFGFMTGEDILGNYILDMINDDDEFTLLIDRLNKFETNEGLNVCTGKKSFKLSSLFK